MNSRGNARVSEID